ncbi:MAG: hypothetical protein PHP28_03605 [Actinomycetota bacterium]|nr:hypothetical protein [Actinomycetota bacterium]MDD5667747.1 hypothetical protein [Actinomycetota bacterium]
MFKSKTFIIFLIPVILLALGIWTVLSTEVDRGDVRVAGALIGDAEVGVSVTACRVEEVDGARKLVVELEAENSSPGNIKLVPNDFSLILAKGDRLEADPLCSSFTPIRYSSECDAATDSASIIPAGAVRSITLVFWGETMPRGEEWEDHILSLEYYDETAPLIMSTLLSPTEE